MIKGTKGGRERRGKGGKRVESPKMVAKEGQRKKKDLQVEQSPVESELTVLVYDPVLVS